MATIPPKTARRAMDVDDADDEDPIPNELDNALVHLIPAIAACSSDPALPSYLDLATFEELAGPALRVGMVAVAGNGGSVSGGGGGKDAGGGGGCRRRLDDRVSEEIEVAFRHCMHEAGLALAGPADDGGESGRGGRGGRGEGKARKGSSKKGAPLELERMVEMMAEPLGISSLALKFVMNEAALDKSGDGITGALAGLPLLLLEDFLESQGRKACKVFWSTWVEPNATSLRKLLLMKSSSRYTLIRLGNKLARRMSKTHDSSFCGQIHMFMAEALPFFEQSGLNMTGGINLANVTAFEDEEQFRRTMEEFEEEDEAAAAAAAAAVPPGDRSDPMDVDATGVASGDATKKGGGGGGGASGGIAADYPLYHSFWRLQKYGLRPDKAVKGEEAKETWQAMLGDVDKILGAFEANAFSEHDLRLAREKWAADGAGAASAFFSAVSSPSAASSSPPPSSPAAAKGAGTPGITGKQKRGKGGAATAGEGAIDVKGAAGEGGGSGIPVYFGVKYLTSSRLLRLQLRDPTLRLQLLTQWLILAASLKNKVANAKDSPNSVEDLKPRIELAKRLVRATPPRGEEYLGMLQVVLNRESAWTQWKDVNKCKEPETVAAEEARQVATDKTAGVAPPAPAFSNKRPRPTASVAASERAMYAPLGGNFPLEDMVKKLRAGVPTSQEHLEDQKMCAEDPDIPAEELPSASPLYTWRALRLLGRENPANLVGCYDGDLVKTIERLEKAARDGATAGPEESSKSEAAPMPASSAAGIAEGEVVAEVEAAEGAGKGAAAAAKDADAATKLEEGRGTSMSVDGAEDGEVEVKKEVVAPAANGGASAESTANPVAGSNGGSSGSKKDVEANGGAATDGNVTVAAAAADGDSGHATEAAPAVPVKVEEPSSSRPAHPAAAASADDASAAASANDVRSGIGSTAPAGDGDARGKVGDGTLAADAARAPAPSDTVAGSALKEPSKTGKKPGENAGRPAQVAPGTKPTEGTTSSAKEPLPSPTRTSRRAKSVQNGGDKK